MCAVSSGGQGAWSDEASFKTPPTLPRPPINVGVSGKVTLSSAIITWSKLKKHLYIYTTKLFNISQLGRPDDGGASITSYDVQLCEAGRDWETVATVAEQLSFSAPSPKSQLLSHTLTNLTPGTEHSVRINCRNSVGVSKFRCCTTLFRAHPLSLFQTSGWSECVSLTTTPGPPSPPHTLTLTTVTSHTAHLQWKVKYIF